MYWDSAQTGIGSLGKYTTRWREEASRGPLSENRSQSGHWPNTHTEREGPTSNFPRHKPQCSAAERKPESCCSSLFKWHLKSENLQLFPLFPRVRKTLPLVGPPESESETSTQQAGNQPLCWTQTEKDNRSTASSFGTCLTLRSAAAAVLGLFSVPRWPPPEDGGRGEANRQDSICKGRWGEFCAFQARYKEVAQQMVFLGSCSPQPQYTYSMGLLREREKKTFPF